MKGTLLCLRFCTSRTSPSSYRLQKEKILATSTLGKLRQGDTSITVGNLNTICTLLRCQPGDLIEWVPEETD